MADERNTSIAAVVKAADDYVSTAHTVLLRSQLAKCNLRPQGGPPHHDNVMGAGNDADVEADGLLDGGLMHGSGFGVGESFSGSLASAGFL